MVAFSREKPRGAPKANKTEINLLIIDGKDNVDLDKVRLQLVNKQVGPKFKVTSREEQCGHRRLVGQRRLADQRAPLGDQSDVDYARANSHLLEGATAARPEMMIDVSCCDVVCFCSSECERKLTVNLPTTMSPRSLAGQGGGSCFVVAVALAAATIVVAFLVGLKKQTNSPLGPQRKLIHSQLTMAIIWHNFKLFQVRTAGKFRARRRGSSNHCSLLSPEVCLACRPINQTPEQVDEASQDCNKRPLLFRPTWWAHLMGFNCTSSPEPGRATRMTAQVTCSRRHRRPPTRTSNAKIIMVMFVYHYFNCRRQSDGRCFAVLPGTYETTKRLVGVAGPSPRPPQLALKYGGHSSQGPSSLQAPTPQTNGGHFNHANVLRGATKLAAKVLTSIALCLHKLAPRVGCQDELCESTGTTRSNRAAKEQQGRPQRVHRKSSKERPYLRLKAIPFSLAAFMYLIMSLAWISPVGQVSCLQQEQQQLKLKLRPTTWRWSSSSSSSLSNHNQTRLDDLLLSRLHQDEEQQANKLIRLPRLASKNNSAGGPHKSLEAKATTEVAPVGPVKLEPQINITRPELISAKEADSNNNNNNNSSGPSEEQPAYRWPFISLVGFMFLGASGNILVCMAVWRERRLQTATNYFLLSLAVADLLVCTLVMPFGIIYEFYGK